MVYFLGAFFMFRGIFTVPKSHASEKCPAYFWFVDKTNVYAAKVLLLVFITLAFLLLALGSVGVTSDGPLHYTKQVMTNQVRPNFV